jgi:hypothetical protein
MHFKKVHNDFKTRKKSYSNKKVVIAIYKLIFVPIARKERKKGNLLRIDVFL